jgi:hypothetical protein
MRWYLTVSHGDLVAVSTAPPKDSTLASGAFDEIVKLTKTLTAVLDQHRKEHAR